MQARGSQNMKLEKEEAEAEFRPPPHGRAADIGAAPMPRRRAQILADQIEESDSDVLEITGTRSRYPPLPTLERAPPQQPPWEERGWLNSMAQFWWNEEQFRRTEPPSDRCWKGKNPGGCRNGLPSDGWHKKTYDRQQKEKGRGGEQHPNPDNMAPLPPNPPPQMGPGSGDFPHQHGHGASSQAQYRSKGRIAQRRSNWQPVDEGTQERPVDLTGPPSRPGPRALPLHQPLAMGNRLPEPLRPDMGRINPVIDLTDSPPRPGPRALPRQQPLGMGPEPLRPGIGNSVSSANPGQSFVLPSHASSSSSSSSSTFRDQTQAPQGASPQPASPIPSPQAQPEVQHPTPTIYYSTQPVRALKAAYEDAHDVLSMEYKRIRFASLDFPPVRRTLLFLHCMEARIDGMRKMKKDMRKLEKAFPEASSSSFPPGPFPAGTLPLNLPIGDWFYSSDTDAVKARLQSEFAIMEGRDGVIDALIEASVQSGDEAGTQALRVEQAGVDARLEILARLIQATRGIARWDEDAPNRARRNLFYGGRRHRDV
ncbi:hypothetical protein MBM_02898 [Drepanopeziza brunnea f. sp. 'multigermtubi' MB_m1]|uniref:Uncharacterized protein n=1 Tax=Marssonina brunnea f. sp. multigermtubi (strain MB_m1) TaxID=1072389 RepID=K1X0J0_MARBU|nr:uncharacterized protein MBM_02898 [Drepanopeziza brunnea f. sp. 'multigermtubi' MB_m1]EKD18656.1 hypothetical protein MBM_02898 [Drepanopeziza brunnea f. sp. 'multigermtubi' MB_m1]